MSHLNHPEELCLTETARDATEHMFANAQSLHSYLRVKVGWAENDHEADVFPQEDIVHPRCKEGNTEAGRHCLRLGEHSAPNGLDSEALVLQLPDHPPGSGVAAEHPDTR